MSSRAPQCCTWRSGVQPSHRPLHRAARQGAATTEQRGKVRILSGCAAFTSQCRQGTIFSVGTGSAEPDTSSSTRSHEYMSPPLTDDLRDDEFRAADRLGAEAPTIARHIIEAVTPSVDAGG